MAKHISTFLIYALIAGLAAYMPLSHWEKGRQRAVPYSASVGLMVAAAVIVFRTPRRRCIRCGFDLALVNLDTCPDCDLPTTPNVDIQIDELEHVCVICGSNITESPMGSGCPNCDAYYADCDMDENDPEFVPLKNHCKSCGYNLRGNTSGKCPECGQNMD